MNIPKSLRHSVIAAAAAAGLGMMTPSLAEDIDLYVGGEAATGSQANVLIVLDNSTNWAAANQGWLPSGTKQGEAELQALSEILSTLGDNINVGLLMAAGSNGGYVRFGVREMSGTNKTAFTGMLNTMVANFGGDGDNDDKVNTSSIVYDSMLNAAYRYFNGFARFGTTDLPSGSTLDLRDYTGSTVNTTKQPAGALSGNSLATATSTTYLPPSTANDGCAKNFIIFIGNGYPNQAGTTTDLANAAALAGITDSATVSAITASVSGGSPKIADEWTRFMYTYGVTSTVDDPKSTSSPKAKLVNKIATYTIDVCKDACEADQATLLKSMAKVGGGKYYKSTSKQEIKNAMSLIFAEIQAVNSVFASATLPISVNTQGTFENQVYIGVFRPDSGARPRWFGNLKEYKFGRYCDADRNDKVLIDNTRALVNGMVTATLTGNATGTVTGTFSGTLTTLSGSSAVSGTVAGTVSGTSSATLAATFGGSPGTTGSPAVDAGSGTVTGTITGTGSGTGSSTFTGTLNGISSLSGSFTASDERIGDDVPAPNCGTDASGDIPLNLYLGDQHGYRAIDEEGNTGFIDLSAKSYWTSASSFWTATPNATGGASDSPDGPEVERGAAAQRLRTAWATTATSPHPDGRRVYTCLGTCLASAATASQKTLSNNAVTTSNSEVTAALAAPSGSATVTLARSGNTVTATSTAAHGFADGASVTIAGATPTDYNGAKTITYVDATHFTYILNESPTTTDAATATKPGGTVTVTSISLSGTVAGTTVTATVTTNPAHGLIAGNVTTIAGAAQSFLNGSHTVLGAPAVTGTTFAVSVTLPANPTTPATTAGSAVAVGQSATHSSISYSTSACVSGGTAGCAVVLATANLGNKFVTGNTVVVSNAAPDAYNTGAAGTTIRATGTSCPNTATLTITNSNKNAVYCYTVAAQPAVVTPDGGASKTATSPGTSFPINITRTLGSTTATAVTTVLGVPAPHGFVTTDNISITGAAQSQYNGTFQPLSVGVPDANTFTFGPISLTPATPPTGTITATTGTGVAGPDTTNLILWTRGKDLWEDEDINASLTNVRASIHGDVLHARPVVVNYGSSIGIVGFYGANDGFLRAIHGGTADIDGEEKWAFMPSEFMTYTKLARLYSNSEVVRYPNLSCSISPTPTARNYFWDGSLTAYQSPDGTASTAPSKTWLFATMRRGGRALYALDVTDPDVPKFMWRITNASTGFSELAQTWSEPKIAKLKGTFTRADATVITNPVVLVFGAGYDAAQEDKPSGSHVTPTMGRGVFVVEAETGQLIQFLQPTSGVTGYSFAADVNALDLNADGYLDRIYAGDTNANLFRFDTVQTVTNVASSSYWKRYHLAKVGDTDANGGVNARKFLFAPEVLPFLHNGVIKTMVLVGSGNREKPLPNFQSDGSPNTLTCSSLYTDTYYPTSSSNKINDRFFGLLDPVQSGATESTVNADPIVLGDLQQINSNTLATTTLTPFSLSSSDRGWHILLRNDPDGNGTRNEEKSVNAAKVVAGVVFFATNTPVSPNPSAGVCSNLGEALGYAVDPFTGMPAINRDDSTSGGVATYTSVDFATKFSGGGLPPTVTAGVVSIGGTPYRFIIGSGGDTLTSASSIAGARSVINLRGTRSRLYWSYGAD